MYRQAGTRVGRAYARKTGLQKAFGVALRIGGIIVTAAGQALLLQKSNGQKPHVMVSSQIYTVCQCPMPTSHGNHALSISQ